MHSRQPVELFSIADEAIRRAKDFVERSELPGVALKEIRGIKRGFQPKGSHPWYEQAAPKVGMHLHYACVLESYKLVCYVLLTRHDTFSNEELTQIIKESPRDWPFRCVPRS